MDHESIKNKITELLAVLGFGEEVEGIDVHEGATNRFSVRVREAFRESIADEDGRRASPASMLIGSEGGNLLALEHILKKLVRRGRGEMDNAPSDDMKFTLDINDYRVRRLEDLKQSVKAAAKAVRLYGREVPLRPMSSFERRIVHLLLAEYPDITTESAGEEPARRVIIRPYSFQ